MKAMRDSQINERLRRNLEKRAWKKVHRKAKQDEIWRVGRDQGRRISGGEVKEAGGFYTTGDSGEAKSVTISFHS